MRRFALTRFFATLGIAALVAGTATAQQKVKLLNVSYDPTRELYTEINAEFVNAWKKTNGQAVEVQQSHGGSGKQARAVIDGLEADVVTLALAHDIDVLSTQADLVPSDWQTRLPENSSPYTSTIVFLVRKGNPKGIKDWDDLARTDVSVITPNPKTSGGARWNYLAAWGYALRTSGNDEAKARDFVARIFKNVPVLDTGARGSTNTFVQRGMGDVFISWENEAILVLKEFGKDRFEMVVPSVSILAEPPVAVVDKVVDKRGTRKVAEGYLNFLYTEKAQEIIGKNHFRPRSKAALDKFGDKFAPVELFTIDEVFGGWAKAQKIHFDEGGVFDKIMAGK